jgi:putative membrane protein
MICTDESLLAQWKTLLYSGHIVQTRVSLAGGFCMKLRTVSRILLVIYGLLTVYAVSTVLIGRGFSLMLTPLNTLIAFAFALVHSVHRLNWKSALLLFAVTFVVSLAFESLGVATGWVYGAYHYSDKLGVKVFGLVPLLIPIAWIMMSYPSFVIARLVIPRLKNLVAWRLWLAAVGALVMTAWDVAMDPMMSSGGHWIWEQGGAYFGIPLQNFWGWWLTIFVTFALFLWLARITPESDSMTASQDDRLAILSYVFTGLGSILVDLHVGLGGAGLAGIFAMSPWVMLAWLGTGARAASPHA